MISAPSGRPAASTSLANSPLAHSGQSLTGSWRRPARKAWSCAPVLKTQRLPQPGRPQGISRSGCLRQNSRHTSHMRRGAEGSKSGSSEPERTQARSWLARSQVQVRTQPWTLHGTSLAAIRPSFWAQGTHIRCGGASGSTIGLARCLRRRRRRFLPASPSLASPSLASPSLVCPSWSPASASLAGAGAEDRSVGAASRAGAAPSGAGAAGRASRASWAGAAASTWGASLVSSRAAAARFLARWRRTHRRWRSCASRGHTQLRRQPSTLQGMSTSWVSRSAFTHSWQRRAGFLRRPCRWRSASCAPRFQVQVLGQPGVRQATSRSASSLNWPRWWSHIRSGGFWPKPRICWAANQVQVLLQPAIRQGISVSCRALKSDAVSGEELSPRRGPRSSRRSPRRSSRGRSSRGRSPPRSSRRGRSRGPSPPPWRGPASRGASRPGSRGPVSRGPRSRSRGGPLRSRGPRPVRGP